VFLTYSTNTGTFHTTNYIVEYRAEYQFRVGRIVVAGRSDRKEVYLRVPRDEARAELQWQMGDGEIIFKIQIPNEQIYKLARDRYYIWHDYTKGQLLRLFTSDRMQKEFVAKIASIPAKPATLQERIQQLHQNIEKDINVLRSMIRRLELFEEETGAIAATKTPAPHHKYPLEERP
jgi:hypothetical protein